eukprot:11951967-Heterocapsa_arctica.AAC.1
MSTVGRWLGPASAKLAPPFLRRSPRLFPFSVAFTRRGFRCKRHSRRCWVSTFRWRRGKITASA